MSITVSVILDKKRESKKGYPVKLRITENRIQNFIALKIYLSDDEFKKIRIGKRLSEPQKQIEQQIKASELNANSIINKLDNYSFSEFRAIYENKQVVSEKSIEKLIQVRIDEFKNQNKISSANIYGGLLSSMKSFKPNIKIDKIDSKFLHSFQSYLTSKDKTITTISIYMRSLRAIINANKSLINKYPFESYKIPQARNNKRAVKETELNSILSYSFQNQTDNFYLDMFKLSYYIGGANLVDICKLKARNIQGDYLVYNRSKTSKQIKIYILPQAKEIIEKYDGGEYLFPLITNEDSKYLYDRSHNIVKSINKRLKKMCLDLSIDKITTYSARHSFATNLMSANVSIAFISQSLGHTSISTTQNYLGSFTDKQMQENMKMLEI